MPGSCFSPLIAILKMIRWMYSRHAHEWLLKGLGDSADVDEFPSRIYSALSPPLIFMFPSLIHLQIQTLPPPPMCLVPLPMTKSYSYYLWKLLGSLTVWNLIKTMPRIHGQANFSELFSLGSVSLGLGYPVPTPSLLRSWEEAMVPSWGKGAVRLRVGQNKMPHSYEHSFCPH